MYRYHHDAKRILFVLIPSVFHILASCDKSSREQIEDSFDVSFQEEKITPLDYRPSPEPGDSFQEIQKEGKFFVDKTPFLERLLDGGGKFFYYFSPDTDKQKLRTVLVQMMVSFFKGEKTYFENLSIYERGNGDQRGEWVEYPVIYLDFAAMELKEDEIVDDFKRKLRNELLRIATVQYGLIQYTENGNFPISSILGDLVNQKKRSVVILIDNYGSPERMIQLCDHLAGWEQKEKILGYRKTFREFIKNCSIHSKIVFVTGSTGYDFTRTDGLNFDYFVHVNPDHFDLLSATDEAVINHVTYEEPSRT